MISNEVQVQAHTMNQQQWAKWVEKQHQMHLEARDAAYRNYLKWQARYEQFCERHAQYLRVDRDTSV